MKDNKLSKMNGRDVYKGSDGTLYALDTQHGHFEVVNPKNGKHLGEVDFDFNQTKRSDKTLGVSQLHVKPGILQSIDQPVPVVSRLDHYTL